MGMRSRRLLVLAAAIVVAGRAAAAAQDTGASLFKAKCQACHGPAGMADSGIGKMMKVKPVTDASVKSMSEAQMIETVRNGAGKMQPYKDSLSDAQIRDVVAYFRTLVK
jgi:mono/diheme cytochrome c family protein